MNSKATFPVLRVGEIPKEENQSRWLIEDLWASGGVGTICGHPKCCKSWLGLDMALSVASATAALGKYEVLEPGRALVYLAEDSLQVVRERVAAIARHRRLELGALDLYVITAPRLRLDVAEDRERLFETAGRLRPRLLLLDPLVRLHAVDENSATEISKLLASLRELQRTLQTAVVLVHHARKNALAGLAAGQSLRGSSDLWAFGDSNLYLRRAHDQLVLSMEHRAAAAPASVRLRLAEGDPAEIHLEIVSSPHSEEVPAKGPLAERVIEALQAQPSMTREELRERLRVKSSRLGVVLFELEREGRIVRGPNGWQLGSEAAA